MLKVQCSMRERAKAMLKKMHKFISCMDCGEAVHHNRAIRCVKCANLHKAKIADRKCKEGKKAKVLKLKSGIEVLNNCFGQVMAAVEKSWFSANG